MNKIRISLDELQVESFVTTPTPAPRRGTVHGHESVYTCAAYTCHPCAEPSFDLGFCEPYGGTEAGTCQCPTNPCVRPSQACDPSQTCGEATCYCQYTPTDGRICDSGQGCSGMC